MPIPRQHQEGFLMQNRAFHATLSDDTEIRIELVREEKSGGEPISVVLYRNGEYYDDRKFSDADEQLAVECYQCGVNYFNSGRGEWLSNPAASGDTFF